MNEKNISNTSQYIYTDFIHLPIPLHPRISNFYICLSSSTLKSNQPLNKKPNSMVQVAKHPSQLRFLAPKELEEAGFKIYRWPKPKPNSGSVLKERKLPLPPRKALSPKLLNSHEMNLWLHCLKPICHLPEAPSLKGVNDSKIP